MMEFITIFTELEIQILTKTISNEIIRGLENYFNYHNFCIAILTLQ